MQRLGLHGFALLAIPWVDELVDVMTIPNIRRL